MSGPRMLSTFTGYGGLDIAARRVLGGQVVACCDNDPAATAVLAHHHPHTPNLGDITRLDWHDIARRWRIHVLLGGFPCQDLSCAGRRAGLAPDTRSGLWTHLARGINVLRPDLVVIENVRGILSAPAHRDLEPGDQLLGDRPSRPVLRALGAVLGDLAELGYDARWCGLRAADVGAPHARFRVFLVASPAVAHTDRAARHQRGLTAPGQAQSRWPWTDAGRRGRTPAAHPYCEGPQGSEPTLRQQLPARSSAADSEGLRRETSDLRSRDQAQRPGTDRDRVLAWGGYEPAIRRWEHFLGRPAPAPTEPGTRGNDVLSPQFVEWLQGLAPGHVTAVPGLTRADQLRLLGNGVVPQQAATALHTLLNLDHPEEVPA